MSFETAADNILGDLPKNWQGWALVVTSTPLLERMPKARATTRDKARLRLLETAATLFDRMEVLARAGSDEPSSLESIIHHSHFHDCLFLAQWHEALKRHHHRSPLRRRQRLRNRQDKRREIDLSPRPISLPHLVNRQCRGACPAQR